MVSERRAPVLSPCNLAADPAHCAVGYRVGDDAAYARFIAAVHSGRVCGI
jgi:hypothetical protein